MDVTLNKEEIKFGVDIFKGLWKYIIGSVVLAIVVALISGIIAYLYFSVHNSKKNAIDA